ncbi:hypothetical protein BV898_01976 [Hypsibius exemplaris]|uniref:Uncharacterized protein n=1 Tax=Hypsibius exemplaris TaxID=2072580 RepID=A0A1W0X903_HYPEX|nr:hypothetical protein BV898_01976 [Hypsibius exemplaris]
MPAAGSSSATAGNNSQQPPGRGSGGGNKMRIRAFPQNNMDEEYVNKIWGMLKSAIQEDSAQEQQRTEL